MSSLYITEQGAGLTRKNGNLVVEKDNTVILEVNPAELDNVLLFGNIRITIPAIQALFSNNAGLSLLTSDGHTKGHLVPECGKDVFLRLAQTEHFKNPDQRLVLAKQTVRAKIANSIFSIKKHNKNHPGAIFTETIKKLQSYLSNIDKTISLESLLGIEGICAAEYFKAFKEMLMADFQFPGRKYRPAPDPVNALLSFSYTLVTNELRAISQSMGLDPFIGFLHGAEYGRPSLACDLVEPFRSPLADRLVLTCLNRRMFNAENFYLHQSGACFFKKDSMKRFLGAYEEWVMKEFENDIENTAFRKLFRKQVLSLKSCLNKKTPEYCPTIFK
ncbi:MAG: CRISPR-associated endonuclease Cas1 [bacterium]